MNPQELNVLLQRQLASSLTVKADGTKKIDFNLLLERINQTYTDMDISRKRLERSIKVTSEELNELYEEAQADKKTAEIANESKSQFLAHMSHEIRTPLNGVLGFANLLRSTQLDVDQKDTLDVIIHSGTTLLSLLNGILDLSKVETGIISLENISFNLNDMIENCIALFRGQTIVKKIDLNVYIDPRLPQNFIGDPERLNQILTNLISNALKFTETGGVGLEVVARPDAEVQQDCKAIEFRVTDTGIGIPEDKLGSIFDSFIQADASTTRKYGGTGLGLSISKHLVELMGGQINVTSQVNTGSTFSVALDLPISKNNEHDLLSTLDISPIYNRRALVVDNTQINRKYFKFQLEDFGMQCVTVDSVDNALIHLKANHSQIDIVITDYLMPKRDGLELIQEIRGNPLYKDLPIILSSSAGLFNNNFKSVGYDALVPKPVSQRNFLTELTRLLGAQNPHMPQQGDTQSPIDSAKSAPLDGLRILVAEDNHINQKLMKKFLSEAGCIVDLAGNGREAVHAARDLHYDLILMDIRMPIMDGQEAIACIRKLPAPISNTPIIVLTANAMKGDKEHFISNGANDYLPKPVDLPSLMKTVQYWVNLSAIQDTAAEEPEIAVSDILDITAGIWDAA